MIEDIVNWYNWPKASAKITDMLRSNIVSAFNKEKSGSKALDDSAAEAKRLLGW
jgi:hypothetical protein